LQGRDLKDTISVDIDHLGQIKRRMSYIMNRQVKQGDAWLAVVILKNTR
jgi:hypothetical protein